LNDRILRTVKKYIVLLRLKISLVYFFCLALGFTVAADQNPQIPWWKPVIAFLAFFFGSFFSSTMNFYADVEADRIFQSRFKDMDLKEQPFVKGEMSPLETALAFAVSFLGCIILSILAGLRVFYFLSGFMLVVGVLYSHPWFRLKAKPITDILCNVSGLVLCLCAGMSLGVNYLPPVAFLIWGALFISVGYIPTVVNDVPFDSEAGYKTTAVFFGAERCLKAMVPICVLMIIPALLVLLNPHALWQFKLWAGLGTILDWAGTFVVFKRWRPPHVDLNPDVVLIPMDIIIVLFLLYGFARLARA